MMTLALVLLIAAAQEAPAAEPAPPAAPAVPVSAEVASARFCTAVMMLAQGMAAEQAGADSSNAIMAQSMAELFQNERRRLGDADDAAVEAERAALVERARAAGGPANMTAERARFEAECLPVIMNSRSG